MKVPFRSFPLPFWRQGSIARLLASLWLAGGLFLGSGCSRQPRIRIVVQQSAPLLDVAAREAAARLQEGGFRVQISSGVEASASLTDALVLNVAGNGSGMKPESFEITPIRTHGYLLLRVTGADFRATLWGALEVADQIVAEKELEAVRTTRASAFLPTRAMELSVPVTSSPGPEQARERAQWQRYFDLLVRNRFNTVFFRMRENVAAYVHLDADGSATIPAESRQASIDWMRGIFRIARDRGLSSYVALDKSAVAGLLAKPVAANPSAPMPSSPEPQTEPAVGAPPAQSGPLPRLAPALLETYPELDGVALAPELVALGGPVERRAGWVTENFLAPLAAKNERRPVFLGTDGAWWPAKTAFGGIEPNMPVYLWAPFADTEPVRSPSDIPVLWQVASRSQELRPWQDPTAVRDTVLLLGANKSLGFLNSDPNEARAGGTQAALEAVIGQNWFGMMLWGRLGYSPDISAAYWEQQFASHFGDGGRLVYSAAIHGNQVLALLRSSGRTSPGSGSASAPDRVLRPTDADFAQSIFRLASGPMRRDLITDALSRRGLLLNDSGGTSSASLPEAMEQEAHQTLDIAAAAAKLEAWKTADDEAFHRRLQTIARMGLAYADYLRAAQSLALFVIGGGEQSRQEALRLLGEAQAALAAGIDGANDLAPMQADVAAPIDSAIEMAKQLQPWRWEVAKWEVGTRDALPAASSPAGVPSVSSGVGAGHSPPTTPALTPTIPAPQQWRYAQISRLAEFGLYGRQPWMSSVNQQLRSAFLPFNADEKPAAGSLLIGRAQVTARREGYLVLRLVADQPCTIWVNRRRATRLSPQQFPWVASSPPAAPLQAQLLYAAIVAGANEVLVATSATENWPLVSVNFLTAPEAKDTISISIQAAAELAGGVVFRGGTETEPQPHIGLAEEPPIAAAAVSAPPHPENTPSKADNASPPIASYRFPVRLPGFYRLRFWRYWRAGARPSLNLTLDGSALKKSLGEGDLTIQKWHWSPVEGIFDLGAGPHTLTISNWKSDLMVGAIEVYPSWTPPLPEVR